MQRSVCFVSNFLHGLELALFLVYQFFAELGIFQRNQEILILNVVIILSGVVKNFVRDNGNEKKEARICHLQNLTLTGIAAWISATVEIPSSRQNYRCGQFIVPSN